VPLAMSKPSLLEIPSLKLPFTVSEPRQKWSGSDVLKTAALGPLRRVCVNAEAPSEMAFWCVGETITTHLH
jgi:hypothetical protein